MIAFYLLILPAVPPQDSAAVERAKKTVAAKPDDPVSNRILAVHYASLQDWDAAIPCFGKSGIDAFVAAVEAESKYDGSSHLDAVGIGDLWAAAVPKLPPARQACIDRASYWYAKGWRKLDDFWKMKVKAKLESLYRPLIPRRGSIGGWSGPVTHVQKIEIFTSMVHSGGSALRLIPNGRKAGNFSFLRGNAQTQSTKTLEFSAWVLSDGTDNLADCVRFGVQDIDGRHLMNSHIRIPMDFPIWTRLSSRLDLENNDKHFIGVEVISFSSGGYILVDDISVKADGRELFPNGGFEATKPGGK